jgi:hypothetical protein
MEQIGGAAGVKINPPWTVERYPVYISPPAKKTLKKL